MIISAAYLKKFIETDIAEEVLEARLQALELLIRKYTNNNFQKIGFRACCDATDGVLTSKGTIPFREGETVQISGSVLNDGIYTVATVSGNTFTVNKEVWNDTNMLVTKVEYSTDIIMGVVDIMRWKLKNEAENSNDTSKMRIQSESLSRHSVTYATDATESDIDAEFGVPKKYLAFLKMYKKARF